MIPSKALIALNVIDLSLIKVLLFCATLEYCVYMFRTSELKLPRLTVRG